MIWFQLKHFLLSLTLFIILLLKVLDIPVKFYFSIIRKYIPKYKELIATYNAIFPCVMNHVYANDSSISRLKGFSDLHSYIFIKDESFIIVSSLDPNIYFKIPFNSIIYHDCSVSGTYGEKYSFYIDLTYNDSHRIVGIAFTTLYYHHKIDKLIHKRYPNLLNDENLYDFICENFPNEEEYERQRNLERNNRSNKIFETSVFHKFTNIDAE